jgi:exopolyphosphatase / guanosine-5'-triphosphate,3'-diphosphate pyrophosphatase
MTAADRAELEGVSLDRAPQIVAGALVAEASMKALGIESVDICPWALREGLILRKLDSKADGSAFVRVAETGTSGISTKTSGSGKSGKGTGADKTGRSGGGESAARLIPVRDAGR